MGIYRVKLLMLMILTTMMMMIGVVLPTQVYGNGNRLVTFLKDNTDTFLVQDTADEGGKAEVLLVQHSEGGDGGSTEPPTGIANAGEHAE